MNWTVKGVLKQGGIGLGMGALSSVGALQLEQHHLYLLIIVLALALGALAGALVGWREAPPERVVGDAVLTAALVAVSLAVGVYAGGAPSTYLRLVVALVSPVLSVGAVIAFAGVVSGWTGYHRESAQGRAPASEPPQPSAGSFPTVA